MTLVVAPANESALRRMEPYPTEPERWHTMTSQTDTFANSATRSREKPIWVSPSEASRLSAIGRTRLCELLKDGTIKSRKVGRKRLVSFASLESLGESQRVDQWPGPPDSIAGPAGARPPVTTWPKRRPSILSVFHLDTSACFGGAGVGRITSSGDAESGTRWTI